MSDDLDDADKATLEGIAARREGTEVCFYEPAKAMSEDALKSINDCIGARGTHITAASFYRLLAADLLPSDTRRALYLDGDIICTGSLSDLFETDLNGCPVAMCFERENAQMSAFNRLGYPPHDGYFNSGVILLDLDAWRSENITCAMLDYLKENAKKLLWHDQDLINATLHGRIFPLDLSYNITSTCFYVFYWLQEEKNDYYARQTQFLPRDDWEALKIAVERPRLVHFFGAKPWFLESDNPFAPVWRCFYSASPWGNEPLQWRNPPTAKARIKRLGRKLFEALHLVEKRKPAGIPYPEEAYASARQLLDRLQAEDARAGK